MARIADEVLRRIKAEVSLVRLLESQGHKLKQHGKDYVCVCPFHADDTPSLVISPDTNLWHCMGACQAGGSVIDWVMKTQGLSFRHAVEVLKAEIPALAAASQPPSRSRAKTLESPFRDIADQQALLHQVIDYYHACLKESPEALAYLEKRGLKNAELIERFKLGYANRSLGYRLPEKTRQAGAEIRSQLQALGILRDSGHEHFNGSLVVPIVNEQQHITEVYGRKIHDNLRVGTAYHLYLPGPHAGVWNVEALQASKDIILCEALIDAMTFWVHGFRHVTCSYGTAGFTADHLAAFKRYGTERVWIAYDADAAGHQAAALLAEKLLAEGIECFRIQLPKGMDVNDYALKMQPAPKALALIIRQAQWLGQGEAPARQLDSDMLAEPPLIEPLLPLAAKEKTPASTPANEVPAVSLGAPSLASLAPDIHAHEIKFHLDNRLYRVRGLSKNLSPEHLKINLRVSLNDFVHVDQLDFYQAKARQGFIKQASIELGVEESVLKSDLGKLLLQLEALQETQQQKTLPTEAVVSLSEDAQREALALLQDPALLSRLLRDFTTCGIVGEETNKLVGYLACVSRKLEKPLAVMIQSSSAAGKSSLMDAILNLMPEEERVQYSAMTGQSLFYMGETNLKHKILAIAEEEGAHHASYALKLLQSEGEVSIASTGKDDTTGNLVTKTYKVEGPVMLFLTTTAIDIDEELLNRCLVLTVNESREQTEAIHALQRKSQTLEGLLQQAQKKHLIEVHRNAQRLLKPLKVVNPYAEQLTFLSDKTRTRRDHMKYLQLINSIALLHQYQRDVKTVLAQGEVIQYVEVNLADIDAANRLAHEVLGRTLDELPPQTRKLLQGLHRLVTDGCEKARCLAQDYRFSRRDIRAFTGWGNTQIRVHCDRLVDMEYLLVHRGQRGASFVYELLYNGEGEGGERFLAQLSAADPLKNTGTTASSRGSELGLAGAKRPQDGAMAAPARAQESVKKPENSGMNGHAVENPQVQGILLSRTASHPALAADGL